MDIRRCSAALLTTALLVLAATPISPPGIASAAPAASTATHPGSWAGLPYSGGLVCSTTYATKTTAKTAASTTTSPLASWDVGASSSAFLTAPVTSSAGVVTGVPPVAAAGPQRTTTIAASKTGFGSAAQIAQYASLISRYGTGSDAQIAEVAHAVIAASVGQVPDCSDPAGEQAIVATSKLYAGPYTLTLLPQTGSAVMGSPGSVNAKVVSASGVAVPGVTVTFSASRNVLSASTATTDATGVAQVGFLIPTGTTATTVTVKATASTPTGLKVVSVRAPTSTTNPSGSSVDAVYPDRPVPAGDTQTLVIEQRANPTLSVTVDRHLLRTGSTITPTLHVGGMNGHAAAVSLRVAGPVALHDGTLCSTLNAASFNAASSPDSATPPTTSNVQVVGDGPVQAASSSVTAPGCYWVSASLQTTDAHPTARASDTIGKAVAVLDASASARLDHSVVGPGASVSGRIDMTHLHGVATTISTVIRGPVRIGYDKTGCSGVDFSGAGSRTVRTEVAQNDAAHSSKTAKVAASTVGLGCYLITGQATLHTGDGDSLDVPISGGGKTVLALAPTVSLGIDAASITQRERLPVRVTAQSTYGQAAHVQIKMLRAPASEFGCRVVDYSSASLDSTSPATAITAGEFAQGTARSAPMTRTGCYQPVAVLTLDANPTVVATSTTSPDLSVLVAQAAPHRNARVVSGPARPQSLLRPTVTAVTVYGALALALVLMLAVLAFRNRYTDGGETNDELRFSV